MAFTQSTRLVLPTNAPTSLGPNRRRHPTFHWIFIVNVYMIFSSANNNPCVGPFLYDFNDAHYNEYDCYAWRKQ